MIQIASWKRQKSVVTSIRIRSRIHKNMRQFVPQDFALSKHTFVELQIKKNAIVFSATVAVRPPSGTTAKTSDPAVTQRCLWCSQSQYSLGIQLPPAQSINPNNLKIIFYNIHVRNVSLAGSRANWVSRSANCSRTKMLKLFIQAKQLVRPTRNQLPLWLLELCIPSQRIWHSKSRLCVQQKLRSTCRLAYTLTSNGRPTGPTCHGWPERHAHSPLHRGVKLERCWAWCEGRPKIHGTPCLVPMEERVPQSGHRKRRGSSRIQGAMLLNQIVWRTTNHPSASSNSSVIDAELHRGRSNHVATTFTFGMNEPESK